MPALGERCVDDLDALAQAMSVCEVRDLPKITAEWRAVSADIRALEGGDGEDGADELSRIICQVDVRAAN